MNGLLYRLRAELGPDQLRTIGLDAYRHDRSGWTPDGAPAAVVFPETTAQVQAILRVANDLATPVVVRGAGTGLSGAATAVHGELVLSTARLAAITELDPVDQVAVVQPGVRTADLDRAAGEFGLRYAPDPASAAISTIGGNIATNAGGLRCAKYGVTRQSVLGLEVVLADGRLIRSGQRTIKGVTGYDLTGLFTGSEGTLGVVVSAILRLRPLPAASATMAAFFDTVEVAVQAVDAIGRSGAQPAVAELVDQVALAAIDRVQGTAFHAQGSAFLLVQTDGAGAEAEADLIEKTVRPLARIVRRATEQSEADELLAARRLALPSLEAQGRVLIEDIAVPRTRLAQAVAGIAEIAERHGVTVATLAHAGDGNLHPIFVADADPVPSRIWDAADEVFALALRLGGTLSGEHGIGLLKRRWLGAELGPDVHALQHDIKRIFDPKNILNPGKAL